MRFRTTIWPIITEKKSSFFNFFFICIISFIYLTWFVIRCKAPSALFSAHSAQCLLWKIFCQLFWHGFFFNLNATKVFQCMHWNVTKKQHIFLWHVNFQWFFYRVFFYNNILLFFTFRIDTGSKQKSKS